MGANNNLYCDICAAKIAVEMNAIDVKAREVAGHDYRVGDSFVTCDGCATKITAWLRKQKADADAKWERTPPAELTVSL